MERVFTRQNDDPMLFAALLTLVALSVIDYYMTLCIIRAGGMEANPIFSHIMPARPYLSYWLKFALTGTGVLTLAALSHLRVARVAVYALVAVYASVIVYELALLSVWRI